ncbi:MAG TPA: hypothetical protein VGH47_00055 [Xanthobacteraceae bacterium]|jgi:hypothetical protein
MTDNIVTMPTPIALRVERLRNRLDAYAKHQGEFADVVLGLATELFDARRECAGDDRAFGAWLGEYGCDDLGRHEREALIKIGEHAELARPVLQTTTSRSMQLIWLNEIKPIIPSVRADAPSPTSPIESPPASPSEPEKPQVAVQQNVESTPELEPPPNRPTATKRSPLYGLPDADTMHDNFLDPNTRTNLGRLRRKRNGIAIWDLILKSIRSGVFGPPTKASIDDVSLRLVLPWLSRSRLTKHIDLKNERMRSLVDEALLPLLLERPELRQPENHDRLEREFELRRRSIDEKNRQKYILQEHEKELARKPLPINEEPILVYGTPLWPILGDLTPRYTYDELRHACWYVNYFMQMIAAIGHEKLRPVDVVLYGRHFAKYMRPMAVKGFSNAVGDILGAYERNPTGETKHPPQPVNFGL